MVDAGMLKRDELGACRLVVAGGQSRNTTHLLLSSLQADQEGCEYRIELMTIEEYPPTILMAQKVVHQETPPSIPSRNRSGYITTMEGSRVIEIIANFEDGVVPVLDKPTLQGLLPELRKMKLAQAHDAFGRQLLRKLLLEVPAKNGSGEISDADLCIRWPSKKLLESIMLQYCALLFEVDREYDDDEVIQKITMFLNAEATNGGYRPHPSSMRSAMVASGMLKRDDLGTWYSRASWWQEPKRPIYF
ncbi:hypothetical protein BJ742DRAFT_743131 [Cladochytrium replicatum]|nr:hypothetical protein BJ742DRAFT_743131 [Cladochytrium replicatum]